LESNGKISKKEALVLASTNIEKLQLFSSGYGGVVDMASKVVAVISARQQLIELFMFFELCALGLFA